LTANFARACFALIVAADASWAESSGGVTPGAIDEPRASAAKAAAAVSCLANLFDLKQFDDSIKKCVNLTLGIATPRRFENCASHIWNAKRSP
jgi:hypothetical protein